MAELSPEIREAIAVEVERVVARSRREEYLRIKDAAALISAHPDTVSRLIREGKLKTVGEGKLTRVLRSSIDQYFASEKTA